MLQQEQSTLNSLINNTDGKSNSMNSQSPKFPRPIFPRKTSFMKKQTDLQNLPILEWSCEEIARQMALLDFELFRKILPKECFHQKWEKQNRASLAPNINALIEKSNEVYIINSLFLHLIKAFKMDCI